MNFAQRIFAFMHNKKNAILKINELFSKASYYSLVVVKDSDARNLDFRFGSAIEKWVYGNLN